MSRTAYTERTLERTVAAASRQFPVVLLTGARQVGKTTLLQHAAGARRRYVTLDDPLLLSLAKADPALFLERFPPPVLIDEIQYAPELLPLIKLHVDRERRRGAFWLTGSQQFQLMRGISESLAGRVAILQVLGLSLRELRGPEKASPPFLTPKASRRAQQPTHRLTLQALYERIWRGSFPGIALHPNVPRDLFYSSYVQTYLQRDIRDLARVGDEMAFLKFLRAAAARTGQLLNIAELARDADVAPNTAKSWLSILHASGLLFLLLPYHSNVTKRLVKTPKLYFLDTGLAAYLTEWSSPATLEAGAMSGAVFETWVVGELVKSYWHNGIQAPFYFYRDKDQHEVDLLIIRDGVVYPVEIKKSATPRAGDVRHFQAIHGLGLPVGRGAVICMVVEPIPLTASVQAVPAGAL